MKMSHEEYIELNRRKVGTIAKGMLDGSVNYLEGAIDLASLRFEVDIPEDDKDFIAFTGVSSEIDHLPIGNVRKNWSKAALESHEPEIERAVIWAKEVSLTECKSLSERFNA
jgi:hypothetical protein